MALARATSPFTQYPKMKSAIFFFVLSGRLLRHTSGSLRMSGERQISRSARPFQVGDFEAADGFVVASRHIHLPVGDGERVGLMVGGNHVLENFSGRRCSGEHVVAGQ